MPPTSYPVVGGRLSLFQDAWASIGAPPSVLRILRDGYSLPFLRPPPQVLPRPSQFTVLSKPDQIKVVDEEVVALLAKGAIRRVSKTSRGLVSRIFVVTKKDGGWRPIINLKWLNKTFLNPPHFRMDTALDAAALLRPGDWTASIDLKDAYFHIPINRRFRRFLRFGWRGRLYEYLVLPFGLCLAPLIFTLMTKPLQAFLHARGIRSIFYLDDILIIGSSKEECQANLTTALHLLSSVGFIVNHKKSSLVPAQHFRFLGFDWDTVLGQIMLDDVKRRNLTSRASAMALSGFPRCRDLQILLGHLTSAIPAVPLIRLHSRFLQLDLNQVYRSEKDAFRRVPLSAESRRDLRWISSLAPLQCAAPMWTLQLEDCEEEVSTDASEVGWGIYFRGKLHRDPWSSIADAPAHINAKELMTLLIFLRDFLPRRDSPLSLLWRTDSSTALAYVRKEGGTVSRPLLLLAREILLFAHQRQIRIFPIFISSEENHLADAASRFLDLPDWFLPAEVFRQIVRRWGLPIVDLFASTESAQVPRFFAWGEAPEAEALDALAQTWDFRLAYAFPPPPILLRVIRKIAVSSGIFLLVTPFWPAQKWFPAILTLRVADVRRLPELPLVIDLTTGSPPLSRLPLLVWKIFGGSEHPPSPTSSSVSYATAGDHLLSRDMTPSGALSETFSVPDEYLSFPSI